MPDCTASNIMKKHSDHCVLLLPLDDFLLGYVFKLCEQGMIVMMHAVSREASDLCQIFHAKLDGAK